MNYRKHEADGMDSRISSHNPPFLTIDRLHEVARRWWSQQPDNRYEYDNREHYRNLRHDQAGNRWSREVVLRLRWGRQLPDARDVDRQRDRWATRNRTALPSLKYGIRPDMRHE
jgi:hypothetical protein